MSSDMISAPEGPIPNVEDEAFEPPTYDEAFPALAGDSGKDMPPRVEHGPWNTKFAVRTSNCTQVFIVPLEERRFKEADEHGFGEEQAQAKICKDIMQKTGVSIEMSLARDQSLTVVIHGKSDAVMKARRMLVNQLQTQANIVIQIPREHHRFILGKSGKKLQELELVTSTKITIPRAEENCENIRIIGTKEGIEKARHELLCISDEQAKLAFERLPVPKVLHPFVCGPNNSIIKQLIEETGVRIHVPPPSVQKDEIVVSGEKEGVMKCKETIMRICEEKKKKCQTVSVEVRKSQHKYVFGPRGTNLQEILAATGVSVEVPPLDSNSETITLRGEQDKLGPALTLVYSKANSVIFTEVAAPAWLHRFIIGKKGANVRKIMADFTKVHIEFKEGQDKIVVEGPPEEVDLAVKALEEVVKDVQGRMDFAEITIDNKFHKHIIGKSGANVMRIKNETGVAIRIPPDGENSNIIRIEGNPEGVVKAKQELQEMATRMENEKSRDIIIEQRFHRTIIGSKGENIREIRDKFNQVQITFPEQGKKSDVVTLRGLKTEVDKCYKHLTLLTQEMVVNNYQSSVQIFKQFHKNIIGKGGANIKKIRDETDTRIDLPNENADSDVILITGKKANVEKAKVRIEAIQAELGNIKEISVEIPHRFHNSMIGAKGRLIRAIMEECGGVNVRFPPEGSKSDKVLIRGPKDDVETAKKQLLDLTSEKELSGFTDEVKAKPEYHKFLIGRGGANIKKVREKTGARVIFPSTKDTDQETITIMGKKESVEEAKTELESLIKDLDKIVEGTINVDPKHHRHFVARRGEVLRNIADDFGGVTVSFPRSGVKSDKVVLKGSKDCVDGAMKRILEIVDDLDSQVTIECIIAQKYHRTVMGAKGVKVQEVTKVHEVGIKFPDRPVNNNAEKSAENGGEEVPVVVNSSQKSAENGGEEVPVVVVNGEVSSEANGDGDKPNKSDIILITGKPENCEAAKAALLDLVPITQEVTVPNEFHRFIIGTKGRDIRRMMDEYDVSISIPPLDQESDTILVSGAPANVARAKVGLEEKVEQLEAEKEEKALRSFQLTVEVDPIHHPKIIGRKGAVISKIRADHDVNVQFPDKSEDSQNIITITGFEKNTETAREEILRIVQELEDMTEIEVRLDSRIHSRIIGARGRGVRKIMDDFKVDIRFPRADKDDPNMVTIMGQEDDAYDCRDHLLNLEEEFLQDVTDQEYLQQLQRPPSKRDGDASGPRDVQREFVVKGAPWDRAPDTSSTEEFPSFGAAVAPPRPTQAWGPGFNRTK